MVHNRMLAIWLLRELAPPITALLQTAVKKATVHLLFAYSSKRGFKRESAPAFQYRMHSIVGVPTENGSPLLQGNCPWMPSGTWDDR